jgi:transposase-like protein
LTLAFVLLEPSDGKLSRSVPRGLGAGNRAWLPSIGPSTKRDTRLISSSLPSEDRKAASRFLRMAIAQCGTPEKITIDKSGANTAAIESYNAAHETGIEIRQVKYLNNIVEQDHRAIKRMTRPMLGFKSFWSAAITLAGIELMHMIRKGQLQSCAGGLTPAQFYSLAG